MGTGIVKRSERPTRFAGLAMTLLGASLVVACAAPPPQPQQPTNGGARSRAGLDPGHLALPTLGKGPGVLVLHAWWGLNETVKDVCNRLADEGYVAYAPDLYYGRIATSPEEAERLAGEVFEKRAQTEARVGEAARYLREHTDPEAKQIGVIGFSLGAFFASGLSVAAPSEVGAVVLFYGTREDKYDHARAAYLGHFAEDDPFEPAAQVEAFEQSLRDAGRRVTFHTYPGTGHWFFEPDRPDAFDEEAARLAWERTLAFLGRSLPK